MSAVLQPQDALFANWQEAEDGIGFKVTDTIYHSSTGVSSSDIKKMAISPLHYENKELFKFSTKSIGLGSLYHAMVLEPHLIGTKYIKEEFEGAELNKNTKAYKEAKAEFVAKHAGKEIIDVATFNTAEKMATITKTISGESLNGVVTERAFKIWSKKYNEWLKIKVDALNLNYGVAIDLKSTSEDVTNRKFLENTVAEYKYHVSAALYLDVLKALGYKVHSFMIIFQSNTAPYYCMPYVITKEAIELGRMEYQNALSAWKEYKDNGTLNIVKPLGVPDWYVKKIQGEQL